MRKLILILAALPAFGTTYYVRSDGTVLAANKANATSCAAAASALNLTQANAATFADGDIVDHCANTYRATGVVHNSGTSTGIRYTNGIFKGSDDLSGGATYKWTLSGHGTNEYHLEAAAGGTPGITQPTYVWIAGFAAGEGTAGTLGQLADHGYAWGDNDTLGYSTLYIRDNSGDPDVTGVLIEGSKRANNYTASARSYIIFDHMTMMHSSDRAIKFDTSGGSNAVRDVNCIGTVFCLGFASQTSATVSRVSSIESVGAQNQISFGSAGSGTLAVDSVVIANANIAVSIGTSTGVTITNLTVLGSYTAVQNAGTAAVTVTNSYWGDHRTSAGVLCNNTSTGSITYSYTNILATAAARITGGCTDGGNNTYLPPQFTSYRRHGYWLFTMDDRINLDEWEAAADVANPLGIPMTLGLSQTLTMTAGQWTSLTPYLPFNEVATHTMTGSDLSYHNGFTIHYVGAAAAATMTINKATNLLRLVDASTHDFDLSNARYTTDTSAMANLIADIKAIAGYNNADTAKVSEGRPGFCLADVAGVDIKTATYTAAHDEAIPNGGRWVDEIDGTKADVLTNTGYTVTTLHWPTTAPGSAASITAASSRLIGARGEVGGTKDLTNISIFNAAVTTSTLDTTSDATIQRHVWALLERASERGEALGFYTHGWNELNQAQWTVALKAAAQFQGGTKVVRLRDLISDVKSTSAGWLPAGLDADGTGLRWTRVWLTDYSNYRPRMGSPMCGTGAAIAAGTTDLDGLPYLTNDKGAYRCAPKVAFGGVM